MCRLRCTALVLSEDKRFTSTAGGLGALPRRCLGQPLEPAPRGRTITMQLAGLLDGD